MYPVRPTFPEPSPPFHHTWFPESPAPPRKLQAVRFAMLTSFAFHTTIPLRPSALPPTTGPKFWYCGSELHGVGAPALVPSTMTVSRFMPRMCRSEVCTTTPPWSPVESWLAEVTWASSSS